MDPQALLDELYRSATIWGLFGLATLAIMEEDWIRWCFHGPNWRRFLSLFIAGPLVWLFVIVGYLADRVRGKG